MTIYRIIDAGMSTRNICRVLRIINTVIPSHGFEEHDFDGERCENCDHAAFNMLQFRCNTIRCCCFLFMLFPLAMSGMGKNIAILYFIRINRCRPIVRIFIFRHEWCWNNKNSEETMLHSDNHGIHSLYFNVRLANTVSQWDTVRIIRVNPLSGQH